MAAPDQPPHLHQVLADRSQRGVREPGLVPPADGARHAPLPGLAIAIELSIISNFLINNYWTFADRELVGAKRIRGLKFNVVSLLSLAVSYGTFLLLSLLLPRVAPLWLQGLAIIPAVLVNYFLNSYWTFRETGRE